MTDIEPESIKAIEDIAGLTDKNTRIVFVSGNFNIVHPGHLRLLRYAAECGDYLVVGVKEDGNDGVLLPEDLRLSGLAVNSWVNYSFILRDPPERFIAHLRPSIVVKGKEHENKENPELDELRKYGGKLLFSSGDWIYYVMNSVT